jgi:3-isopropylmalate dehydratase small subunit
MKLIRGRIWTFGDGIDTDVIIPARHLVLPLAEMKHKAMEPLRPAFSAEVRPGDILVAGRNFGCGSSREQAVAVLRELGIAAIVADSFARIFFRNAINLGIPVVECPGLQASVREGETVEIDLRAGTVCVPDRNLRLASSRLPDFLLEIIDDGGLIPHLAAKLRAAGKSGAK